MSPSQDIGILRHIEGTIGPVVEQKILCQGFDPRRQGAQLFERLPHFAVLSLSLLMRLEHLGVVGLRQGFDLAV